MPTVDELRKNIVTLYEKLGAQRTKCRGKDCGADIWQIRKPNGRSAPYTIDALNHFIDCPNAEDFKTKRPAREQGNG